MTDFSLSKLIRAIFIGAQPGEEAASYTRQLTALIGLYLCCVALFLLWLFLRRVKNKMTLNPESQKFFIWMIYAGCFSIIAIGIVIGHNLWG